MKAYNSTFDFSGEDLIGEEEINHQETQVNKIIISIVAICLMTVAVLANTTLLLAIFNPIRRKNLFKLTRSNDVYIAIFIAVLSVDDILMALINGIALIQMTIQESQWFLGDALCRIRHPVLEAVLGTSCWLMMLIAIERKRRLTNKITVPFSHLNRVGLFAALRAGLLVAAIVLVHSLISIPAVINSKLFEPPPIAIPLFDSNGTKVIDFKHVPLPKFCVQYWESPLWFTIYVLIKFAISFLIPLAVTFVLHISVIKYLNVTAPKSQNRARYLKQTTNVLVAVLVVFAICWSPYRISALLIELRTSGLFKGENFHPNVSNQTFIHSVKLLTILQACLNPLLYGFCMAKRTNMSTRGSISQLKDSLSHLQTPKKSDIHF